MERSLRMLSRRSFLGMLAATPLAAAASRAPVIDSHLHVWTNDTVRFPFAHPNDRNFKPPPIAGTVEAPLDEMDQQGVDAAVLVQVIYYGWDNRCLADCLRKHPSRFRGQGLIDPTDPNVADQLEYWMREH